MIRFVIFTIFFLPSFGFSQDCGFQVEEDESKLNIIFQKFTENLANEDLVITQDKNSIPKQVKTQLDCLTNGFDIANPNDEYQDGCSDEKEFPTRHLTFLAKSENYLLISYNTYNLGISSYNLWIKYDHDGIIDFWSNAMLGELNSKHLNDTKSYIELIKELNKPD